MYAAGVVDSELKAHFCTPRGRAYASYCPNVIFTCILDLNLINRFCHSCAKRSSLTVEGKYNVSVFFQ